MSVSKARKNNQSLRGLLFIVEMASLAIAANYLLGDSPISFDLAPAVIGHPLPTTDQQATEGFEAVNVTLNISTLVDPGARGTIGQLLYQFRSHGGQSAVIDYIPKTELASSYDGPIEVTLLDETSQHAGLKVTAAQDFLARADLGTDREKKNTHSAKFRRQAIQESIVTSGTVDQSRGVYFKLRSNFDRTLEGDKSFHLVLLLPLGWQTELLDITLEAWGSSHHRDPVAGATFPVAVWRAGDEQARHAALSLADAVQKLRHCAVRYDQVIRQRSYPSVFHRIGAVLDVVDPKIPSDWLTNVMFASVDPYHDPQITKMPVDVRVAILDYQEARGQFLAIVDQGGRLAAR